jgi:thiamine biosynthesis protein ThiC
MVEVAKDEDIDLDFLVQRVASGSIIIPKNNVRKQNIKVVGIGRKSLAISLPVYHINPVLQLYNGTCCPNT